MKHALMVFFLGYLTLMTASCSQNPDAREFPALSPASVQLTIVVSDEKNEANIPATSIFDFSFEDSRAACQATKDCVLMTVGRCDTVQGIHVSQIATAQAYSTQSKEQYPDVVCAPDWPMEDYQPYCLNQKCRAILEDYHLILEVPEQPVAGQPFWVGMSFRLAMDVAQLTARFLLPEDVKIISGQATWSGPVEAGREYVIWVEVETNKTGDLYLSGWTGIQQGDQTVPSVTWSDHFYVSSPLSITPWPEREFIVATPTPVK